MLIRDLVPGFQRILPVVPRSFRYATLARDKPALLATTFALLLYGSCRMRPASVFDLCQT